MTAIVTGAANGLTKNSKNIGLGGSLCCDPEGRQRPWLNRDSETPVV